MHIIVNSTALTTLLGRNHVARRYHRGHTGSDEERVDTNNRVQALKHSSSNKSKSLGSNCRGVLNLGGFRWKRQKSDSFSSTSPPTSMPTCRLDPFKYHGHRRGRSPMGAFREPFARGFTCIARPTFAGQITAV
jgi:hypothetical protein